MTDSSGIPEIRRSKHQDYIPSLNRLLWGLIALLLLLGSGSAFIPTLNERNEQRTQLEAIRREVQEAKKVFQARSREVARLNNDPEYLAFIAREKLNLAKPDETIFRFDAATADPSPVLK